MIFRSTSLKLAIFLGYLLSGLESHGQIQLQLKDSLVADFTVDTGMEVDAKEARVLFIDNHPYMLHPVKREAIPFTKNSPPLEKPEVNFAKPETRMIGDKVISSPREEQAREVNTMELYQGQLYIFARKVYAFDSEGKEIGKARSISPPYIKQGNGFPYPENLSGSCQVDFENGILLSPAREYWNVNKVLRGGDRELLDEIPLYTLWKFQYDRKVGAFQLGKKITTIQGIPLDYGPREVHLSEAFAKLNPIQKEVLLSFAGSPEIQVYGYDGKWKRSIKPPPEEGFHRGSLPEGSSFFLKAYQFQDSYGRIFPDFSDPGKVYRIYRPAWTPEAIESLEKGWDYDPLRWKPSRLLRIERATGSTQSYLIPEGHYIVSLRADGIYARKTGDWARPVLFRFAWPE